jgi:hypothetical protein
MPIDETPITRARAARERANRQIALSRSARQQSEERIRTFDFNSATRRREGHGVSGYATTGTGGGAYQLSHSAGYTPLPQGPTMGSRYNAVQGQNLTDIFNSAADTSVNAMSGDITSGQRNNFSDRSAPLPADRVAQGNLMAEVLGEEAAEDIFGDYGNIVREQVNAEEAQEYFIVYTPSALDRSSQAAHSVHTGSAAPSLVSDGLGRGDFSIHSYSYASSENGSLSTHEQPDTIVSQQSQVRVQNGSGYQNTMLNPTTHDPAMVINPSAPFGQSLAGKTVWRIKQTVPQTNNNATGTHPAHTGEEGPPIQHDGSWLYDIVPQYIPTLADLPQAADQPVRTWGPGIVSNVTPAQGAYQNSRHRHAGIAVEG